MKNIQPILEGMIAAAIALIVELVLQILFFQRSEIFTPEIIVLLPSFIILAALTEEIVKYVFIANNFRRLENKGEIIKNSLLIGFGFFIVEIALRHSTYDYLPLFQFLGVLILHLTTSLLAGIILKKSAAKKIAFLPTILLNFLLHIGYNFFILYLT
jgi:hypothetical protein